MGSLWRVCSRPSNQCYDHDWEISCEVFQGALMVGCDQQIELSPTKVMQCDEKYASNIKPVISWKGNPSRTQNWLTDGFVVINGEKEKGVDVFFCIEEIQMQWLCHLLGPTESSGRRQPGSVPNDLGDLYGPITVVPLVFSSLRSTNVQQLTVDNAVVVSYAQLKAYHQELWLHPASSPYVNVNKDPASYIKMVLSGDSEDVETVAEQVTGGKRKFESIEDFSFAVKRICSSVELSNQDQIVFS
ncbi:hypothetical protein AC1031_007701 [Aphanomyces cochlioides]|nr:hypothetical protein AC1031_007701 [Aphanomyces cochlioides]